MAKATKQDQDDNGDTGRERKIGGSVPEHGVIFGVDPQRIEDEKKDRERLSKRSEPLDPEEIDRLMAEKIALKEKHEGEVNELRRKYREEKAELDQKISEGGGFKRGESNPTLLSNETDEEGRRRYTAGPL